MFAASLLLMAALTPGVAPGQSGERRDRQVAHTVTVISVQESSSDVMVQIDGDPSPGYPSVTWRHFT
jgi:diacylglycerol kinase family enzyme